LEAIYLLNDRPVDNAYLWINNSLWLLVPLIFLVSGFSNRMKNRRVARVSDQVSGAASVRS
jgi:hypothetical protein